MDLCGNSPYQLLQSLCAVKAVTCFLYPGGFLHKDFIFAVYHNLFNVIIFNIRLKYAQILSKIIEDAVYYVQRFFIAPESKLLPGENIFLYNLHNLIIIYTGFSSAYMFSYDIRYFIYLFYRFSFFIHYYQFLLSSFVYIIKQLPSISNCFIFKFYSIFTFFLKDFVPASSSFNKPFRKKVF